MCKTKSVQNLFLHRYIPRCTTTLDTAKTNNWFTAREVKRCFGPFKTILLWFSCLMMPNSEYKPVGFTSFSQIHGYRCEKLFISKKSIFCKIVLNWVIVTYLLCRKNLKIGFAHCWIRKIAISILLRLILSCISAPWQLIFRWPLIKSVIFCVEMPKTDSGIFRAQQISCCD